MYKKNRHSRYKSRFIIAVMFMPATALLALASLLDGTSASYVEAQASFFLILSAILVFSRDLPLIVNVLIFVALIKNFALSQFIKAFSSAIGDGGLRAPTDTAFTMAIAALGTLIGVVTLTPFYRRTKRRGFAPLAAGLTSPIAIGYCLSAFGLIARLTATLSMLAGQESAILVYMGEVTFLGATSLVYGVMRKSQGKRIWSFSAIATLIMYTVETIPSTSKFALLKAPLFVILVHMALRRPPNKIIIVSTGSLLFLVMTIVHPLLNYARNVSGAGGISTAAAFVEALQAVVTDPSKLAEFDKSSESIELKWTNRLYYGKAMGLLGRFTPNQVDDMVVVGAGVIPRPSEYILSSFAAMIPQTIGVQRSSDIGQAALESVGATKMSDGKLNNTNVGLIGEFYLIGGNAAVGIGAFLLVSYLLLLYWLSFGRRSHELFSIPFAIPLFFVIADGNLATLSVITGQTCVLLLFILKAAALMTQRSPR